MDFLRTWVQEGEIGQEGLDEGVEDLANGNHLLDNEEDSAQRFLAEGIDLEDFKRHYVRIQCRHWISLS